MHITAIVGDYTFSKSFSDQGGSGTYLSVLSETSAVFQKTAGSDGGECFKGRCNNC